MKDLIKKIDETENKIREMSLNPNKTKIFEQKISQPCSYEDRQEIKFIFNSHPNVKWTYRRGIDSIMKKVFSEFWQEGGEFGSGIYDFERPGRSVLNKLNTNIFCFCVLMKDINQVLKFENLPPLDIVGVPPKTQISQTERMINLIDKYSNRIFDPNSRTFKTIMNTLTETHEKGEQRENIVSEKLKKEFGDTNVEKTADLGSKTDMVMGIDHRIKVSDKWLTAQTKPMRDMEEQDGTITILGSSGVSKYKTDWMIFEKNNRVFIFDNKNVKIVDGNFTFPKQDLIYSL